MIRVIIIINKLYGSKIYSALIHESNIPIKPSNKINKNSYIYTSYLLYLDIDLSYYYTNKVSNILYQVLKNIYIYTSY